MNYAEVAVNSPGAQRRTFCYAVPPDIKVGHAVWVPFGPRVVQGIVFQLTEFPSVEETKEIVGLIDPRPILSPAQIELARWISEHYLASLFDIAALMMPPGFERRMITFVRALIGASEIDDSSLTPHQRKLLNLLKKKEKVAIAEVEKALGKKEARATIGQLVRKNLVTKTQELERAKVRPKMLPYIRLAVGSDEAQQEAEHLVGMRRALKQAKLLEYLVAESRPIPLSEAKQLAGCTNAVVNALRRKGIVTVEQVQVYRDPLAHRRFSILPAPTLTSAQEAVWHQVQAAMIRLAKGDNLEPPVFLLHGVTGSGKTEVYLRALEQAISLGKRAVVLVPEIALTPQTIDRFASRFPGRVAVLHSKLSVGEHFDEWWRIKEGGFDVVIGSRGAIFAPQPDLGLIVIDEEHEWTYKQQEQSPRYHARDVAIKLAQLTGSVVILGSATPDVVSYFRSKAGDYQLLELPERIDKTGEKEDAYLPKVEIIDLREELKAGNRSLFSRSLAAGMEKALAAKEQVILFLNRRGTATFVQCRNCGYVLRCKRCDVALTYHSAEADLVCHQCNSHTAVPDACPQCGSRRIKFLGIGTQKVAEETARAFPNANLLRWDRDVTRGKHSHEEILDRFLAHEADVLIGTQMIAKGLELPLVTLVGVINADVSLYLPDFRASERTFQILSQVAGRAGRGILAGHVIVQSYNPAHYAIVAASKHDYSSFYEQEISLRRQYENPPFSRLARLIYNHSNNAICQREAQRMHQRLKEERDSWGMDVYLIGPAPAFVQRVRGRYRWQIIIRGTDPVRLLAEVPVPQGWTVDIDPASLL
ncbi:MAG: primosomal protein N' [Dehalococcoidia bacterium]